MSHHGFTFFMLNIHNFKIYSYIELISGEESYGIIHFLEIARIEFNLREVSPNGICI